MTLLILLSVIGVLVVGYIAVRVYTRWYSMPQKLRDDISELQAKLRLSEQEAYRRHDSIWKSLIDLQEDIGRLKEWQLKIDKIIANYNITSQESQEQKGQQILYRPTQRSAMRRSK
jgi:uncharacterized membrane-anchored protein YhcB (DUF1043 family)